MTRVRFKIERGGIRGASGVAYVQEDEDVGAAVIQSVWQDLGTDVQVTIGGVTMFAAAWEDPEHWEEDWAEKLVVARGDVPEAVAALFAAAEEGGAS